MTIDQTRERFRNNLGRVKAMIELYEEVTGSGRGRPSVRESEILRAAVVLLHASLEDLLRTLVYFRLPTSSKDALDRVPFAGGDGRKTSLTLGDLSSYRGRPVDDVISESVGAYLERSNYNHPGDVINALQSIGIDLPIERTLKARIAAMMSRRHQIVHRLDRNESSGRGHHHARSIGRATVEVWFDAVDKLGHEILSAS